MLNLQNIFKSYDTGGFRQEALAGVSLSFREREFVAILGPSGSGKTTLLNIIGGLDRYDSGDLFIGGKSTKEFKGSQWDAYRNNAVGFVFQNYNLIPHISVLQNVELGMTLSGVGKAARRRRALEVLERVGLKDHAKKRPNQLSGGQMQRVAIARAIVGKPSVILADEPTGALDSVTSKETLDLIRELSKDKLVIMVTHNEALANTYASRIVRLEDGKVVSDSHPVEQTEEQAGEKARFQKTAMRFGTALSLSANNILTKKGRTLLTAIASSIGIIGIALILSLSNGFQIQVDKFEASSIAELPIMISQTTMDTSQSAMEQMRGSFSGAGDYPQTKTIVPFDPQDSAVRHTNVLDEAYVDYLEETDPALLSGISYYYTTAFNLFGTVDGKPQALSFHKAQAVDASSTVMDTVSSLMRFTCMPVSLSGDDLYVAENNYDLLAGTLPTDKTQLLLVVDEKNRVDVTLLHDLGFTAKEEIPFDDFLDGKVQIKLLYNDDYYTPYQNIYLAASDAKACLENENALILTISGIVRLKKDSVMPILGEGLAYLPALMEDALTHGKQSAVVKAQRDADYNVLSGTPFAAESVDSERRAMLAYLGGEKIPAIINLYPKDFDTKESLISRLQAYNERVAADGGGEEDYILYTDLAETISSLSGSIMDAITIVLIAFSSIALVVSVIMIGIITYISVLERRREIGVLRALGARKKDISRVFNAETFIIGVLSGLIGIGIARLLVFPVNTIIYNLTEVENVAQMNPLHALALLCISVLLTVLGGFIPAHIAAKKDPVEALRSE